MLLLIKIEVNKMALNTLNYIIYQQHIKTNPNLTLIEYDLDYLYLNNPFKKVVFTSPNDLQNIPMECFNINNPETFLNVLEYNLITDRDFNVFKTKDKELEQKTSKEVYTLYFMHVRNILNKQEINKEDILTIKAFFEEYNKLISYNGYLNQNASSKLNEMSNILNWTLKPENYIETNYAQQLLRQYITNLNNNESTVFNQIENTSNSQSNEKGFTRTLVNPLFPTSNSEDEPIFSSKAGFLSFAALIYIIFNLLVMLVAIAIK